MSVSVTYYIGLHVGAKRPVFHPSPRDGHVMFVSGRLILTALNSSLYGWRTVWMAYITYWVMPICTRFNVTFDIGIHVGVLWVAGVRYVKTKFYCIHRFPTASGNVASMREPLDGSLWWYWIAANAAKKKWRLF